MYINSAFQHAALRLLLATWVIAAALTAAGLPHAAADDVVSPDPAPRWWKGNIHTHSFWSDGTDFPEMIAEWYRTRDYNFLALSDHNVLSEGERWIPYRTIRQRAGDAVLDKYLERFGPHWVETRGQPNAPDYAVRLKPLNEFRALLEQRGKFILLQGEEITDRAEGKPVHMNATNIKALITPLGGRTVREAMQNNLRAVQEQAERAGRPILIHLNHPNYGYAITAEDLAAVVSERFFEVYNGHPSVAHLGDATHPGVEQMWDIANTLRLGEFAAPPLYGIATDDSHEYHGRPGSRPGRGWIMVRSRFLTPEQLVRAVERGNFYASSGVALNDVQFDATAQILSISIAAEEGVTYRTEFIGTRADDRGEYESSNIGRTLKTVAGAEAHYQLSGDELYVRAVVTSSQPPRDPSFDGQFQQAWTQPVGWQRHVAPTPVAEDADDAP